MCYQVMIVEDDPMVAAINKKYTETVPGFRVAGVFRNGAEGLEYLRENHVDLVILDYYMPEMNGDVFMDRIREEGIQVSVIMVTSANSADTVRSLLLKGVRDYLIKPFELERFQAALERFRSNKELLTGAGSGMDQSELDRLFAGNAGSTVEKNQSLELPKGYWVEKGIVAFVPSTGSRSQMEGRVALLARRADGTTEPIGAEISAAEMEVAP